MVHWSIISREAAAMDYFNIYRDMTWLMKTSWHFHVTVHNPPCADICTWTDHHYVIMRLEIIEMFHIKQNFEQNSVEKRNWIIILHWSLQSCEWDVVPCHWHSNAILALLCLTASSVHDPRQASQHLWLKERVRRLIVQYIAGISLLSLDHLVRHTV